MVVYMEDCGMVDCVCKIVFDCVCIDVLDKTRVW